MAEDTIWLGQRAPWAPGLRADTLPRDTYQGGDLGHGLGAATLHWDGVPDRVLVPMETPHAAAGQEHRVVDHRVAACPHTCDSTVHHLRLDTAAPALHVAGCPEHGWTFYTLAAP